MTLVGKTTADEPSLSTNAAGAVYLRELADLVAAGKIPCFAVLVVTPMAPDPETGLPLRAVAVRLVVAGPKDPVPGTLNDLDAVCSCEGVIPTCAAIAADTIEAHEQKLAGMH